MRRYAPADDVSECHACVDTSPSTAFVSEPSDSLDCDNIAAVNTGTFVTSSFSTNVVFADVSTPYAYRYVTGGAVPTYAGMNCDTLDRLSGVYTVSSKDRASVWPRYD